MPAVSQATAAKHGLTVFVVSLLLRAARLWRHGQLMLVICGVSHDWRAASAFVLLSWASPACREVLTLLTLLHVIVDSGMQMAGGVRMHCERTCPTALA